MQVAAALLLSFLILFSSSAISAPDRYPRAPEWVVSEWLNGKGVSVAELRGKVVVVEFFQLWCPGCNRFSIPLMQQWKKRFADEIKAGDLMMLSIHTVFEGHEYQNPERLRLFLKEKGIHHLVGIDKHRAGDPIPETMKRFNTRGTPEMAFIDRQGNIRLKRFGSFNVELAEELIKDMLNEPTP